MKVTQTIHELGFNVIKTTNRKIAIRNCPYCNDGKSKKARGYFLLSDDGENATYYCHNCIGDGADPIPIYKMCMENRRPDLAARFLQQSSERWVEPEITIDDSNVTYLTSIDLVIGKRTIKLFALDDQIKDYLLNVRKIPKDKLGSFLKTDRGFIILYRNENGVYNAQEKNEGGYYFIDESKTKSFLLSNVYNLFNINPTAPIIATEGVFDSLFINNSVSIGGVTKWRSLNHICTYLNIPKIYFLQDNDEPGRVNAIKHMSSSIYVFKWAQFLQDNNITTPIKDINDLYMTGLASGTMTFAQLRKYFTNSPSEIILI